MDTTSFYFEIDDFRNTKLIKSKKGEEIDEKTASDKIYSELNKNDKDK